MQKYGLTEKAREKLPPLIVHFLENNDADKSEEFQNLIRAVAASFSDESKKAEYFRLIIRKRPTDTSLAAMLVNENLIARRQQKEFYETLIIRSEGINSYDSDYKYAAVRQRLWNSADAESVYEQENDYKTEAPEADRIEWQKKYLDLLFELRENMEAAKLIAEIERDLNNRYARPAWLRLANIRRQIRDGKADIAVIENYTGIAVADVVTAIKPPDVERFNDVMRLLKEEKKSEIAAQISESFFARMLALEQFDAANFAGLSRAFIQKGEAEKALQVLRLMIDASDETKAETAAAQVSTMDIIKAKAADATKTPTAVNKLTNRANALKIAAEIAAEFQLFDASIAFRRESLEANPTDDVNKIELAKMLSAKNEVEEANNLLTQIVNDKNSLRSTRWQARMMLFAEIPNSSFDSFSQFYGGNIADNSNQIDAAESFYINSLIADKDAETSARQELIKVYAAENKFFAALKLAEIDKTAKSDALLQTLSDAAEKVGDFQKAIQYEQSKSNGGNKIRIAALNHGWSEQNRLATDFSVDTENTKKL